LGDTFLIIGLGRFGSSVAKHALLNKNKVKVYIRPESIVKRSKEIEDLKKLGQFEVFGGTLEEIDKIRFAAAGVDIVVVAISVSSFTDSNEKNLCQLYAREKCY